MLKNTANSHAWIGDSRLLAVAVPFFASGFAALAYQICWQRLLFAAFGTDIESITIIVSAFMLGLGVGALAGGRVADRFPEHIPMLFALAECGIGLFGLVSVSLIQWLGDATVQQPLPIVAAVNFLLLLVPTSLMGATLPMLVAFLVARNGNVGVSIGGLYFVNTMGAALGAAAVGFVVFHYLDLHQSIRWTSALNFGAAATALALFARPRATQEATE